MDFVFDHDLHVHSQLSLCSRDPEQNTERILQYGRDNGYRHLCLTDHCWDETVPHVMGFYREQDRAHVARALPLPQAEGITFHFGCEVDMNKYFEVGMSAEHMADYDFVIIPTTHLHMVGDALEPTDTEVPRLAELWAERFRRLLTYDLPFHKIGLAHLTTPLLAQGRFPEHLQVIDLVSDATMRELFGGAARVGMGIELNMPIQKYNEELSPEQRARILRPYRIAKECGCKFYFGSDAHHPAQLVSAPDRFRAMALALDLTEEDKFCPFG